MMTSYAGNYEDVRLWRAFRGIKNGFFVDIGACHARSHNSSYSFYEAGWTGVNVEPGPYFGTLPELRPRDTNLKVAVSGRNGDISFFFHDDSPATSTINAELNHHLVGHVSQRTEIVVQSITLRDLADQYVGTRHVHFLAVDVEGAEGEVLGSCDWKTFRPEIVVAEATEPFTTKPIFNNWSHHLIGNGYIFAYFDGINAWFVREESSHLIPIISVPVNQLDYYVHFDDEKTAALEELATIKYNLNELEDKSRKNSLISADLLTEESYRTAAVQTILKAVLACQSWRGLDRKKFRRLIAEAASTIPNDGPAAIQHSVILSEARKVLNITE